MTGKRLIALAGAAGMCAGVALAQDEPSGPPPSEPPPKTMADAPDESKAGRIMAFAREVRREKGCAQAAPAYRAIAGLGPEFEPAQHELGECLLLITGETETETALLREEGAFWLKRAAHAGNARAQRALAMNYASPASLLHNPAESLKWSLVYEKNAQAALFGFKSLPPTLVDGLKSDLESAVVEDAEAFAATFTPIHLPEYKGPKRERRASGERQTKQGHQKQKGGGGGGRRPRQ